jgi:hypothetical protein
MKMTAMGRHMAIGTLSASLLIGALAGPVGAQDASLSGTLETDGEHYTVDGTEVDFGPTWYIDAVNAEADYDGDGAVETIAAELDGLVETAVTLDGEAGRCGDVDVFVINGQTYRSPGRPAWAGGPSVVGAMHPGSSTGDDADDGAGRPSWAPGPPPWAGTGEGRPCN